MSLSSYTQIEGGREDRSPSQPAERVAPRGRAHGRGQHHRRRRRRLCGQRSVHHEAAGTAALA